jgi:hypothetical protein
VDACGVGVAGVDEVVFVNYERVEEVESDGFYFSLD